MRREIWLVDPLATSARSERCQIQPRPGKDKLALLKNSSCAEGFLFWRDNKQ